MKRSFWLGIFVFLGMNGIFLFAQASENNGQSGLQSSAFNPDKIIAHRGVWKSAGLPQNSVAALKAAIASGYAGSEIDVHMTADSALVVNHDPDWAGLPIQKSTLAKLRKTRLSNGEKLPLLPDFLTEIKSQKATRLILEIKSSQRGRAWADATIQRIVKTVKEMNAQDMVTYISFDYEMLREVLRLQLGAITQYLGGDKDPVQLKEDGIMGADYHYSVFQKHPEWIRMAKENGIALNAWTVNDPRVMSWLVANDFDFITTDEPELLSEEIRKSPLATGRKLVWSDEFNYSGLPDSTKWKYNVGGNGWGNNEKQFYTNADTLNAFVNNGVLSIIARKDKKENNDYTSARLVTKGIAEWTYGYVEFSAKLPAGRGLWPAGWMLGSKIDETDWPDCGEIDIMEHVGYEKDSAFMTIHTGSYNHLMGTQKGIKAFIQHPYSEFHTFAIDWSPGQINFLLDGVVYFQFKNENKTFKEWPFDSPFFIILNMAVGGNLGGREGIDDAAFPAVFQIDYVRVYQ